ncbi:MAG: hypothetical protein GF353_14185 [Candidatus Lokiarchaeota archaeon]|nr:hypothetical protein [Candidatus Lokiarchaeota archaeon]
MVKEDQVKGLYFQMIDQLLTEYNPEVAEEAAKELSFDIKTIKPGDWLPRAEINKYIPKVSPQAREAMAKRIYPTIKANTPLLDDAKNPIDVIKKMNEVAKLTSKGLSPEYHVIESKEGHLKVRVINEFPNYPDIVEGEFKGLFELFKILRVNINTEKVSDKELLMEIKWEP